MGLPKRVNGQGEETIASLSLGLLGRLYLSGYRPQL